MLNSHVVVSLRGVEREAALVHGSGNANDTVSSAGGAMEGGEVMQVEREGGGSAREGEGRQNGRRKEVTWREGRRMDGAGEG